MKILFCGTQVPEEVEYQIKDISAAGNRFQNNIIANLKKCGHEVVARAYIGVPVPEDTRKELKNTVFKEQSIIKSFFSYYGKGRLDKLLNDSDAVICYNIIYVWIILPYLANKHHVRSIAIIADYSEEICYNNLVGKLYAKLQRISMRHFDTVIGLSAQIEGKLRKRQKFILMEGGIDTNLYNSFFYQKHKEGEPIILLYSGLLSPVTGLDRLLDIMKELPEDNVRLHISGKGILEEEVLKAQEEDYRIYYLGHLPYEEYVNQLQAADILLNPRNMELPENQNNFPSKIMDYLATGKQIISTKFIGWEKFDECIKFCDTYEEMVEKMRGAVQAVPGAETERIFRKNREFAIKFRWETQINRILSGE